MTHEGRVNRRKSKRRVLKKDEDVYQRIFEAGLFKVVVYYTELIKYSISNK
jgi:hypothetical protein